MITLGNETTAPLEQVVKIDDDNSFVLVYRQPTYGDHCKLTDGEFFNVTTRLESLVTDWRDVLNSGELEIAYSLDGLKALIVQFPAILKEIDEFTYRLLVPKEESKDSEKN